MEQINIKAIKEMLEAVKRKNYTYMGDERVDIDEVNHIMTINWNDGDITQCKLDNHDEWDYELGMLICCAKKVCYGLNLEELYSQTKYDTKSLKYTLKLLLKNRRQNQMVEDIPEFIKLYKQKRQYELGQAHKKEKRKKKWLKHIEEVKKLKQEGKYFSEKEIEELRKTRDNLLAAKCKRLDRAAEGKALKDEIESLKKELNLK